MHVRRTLIAVVALCSLFHAGLSAASEEARGPGKSLVKVAISPGRVDWQPAGDERLNLTVAGPEGVYLQRDFKAGEGPFLSIQESALPDGVYAWELRSAGGETQSGHLWIQEGSFMDKVPPRPTKAVEAASKPPLGNVTANTQIIADDLVVQGQACIGADCAAAAVTGATLHIKDTTYQILFDALNCCFPWENPWALQANEPGATGDFTIRTLGTIPFRISPSAPDNSLTIFGTGGNIGLGTLTPANPLHVKRSNGTAKVFIEETSGTVTPRELLELKNAGGAAFILDDANDVTRWTTTAAGSQYLINNQANVGLEVAVSSTGNVTILGTLTQGSDRTTKTGIIPVQPDEVLAKLVSLPISTWSRKDEDPKVRHLGPMAQDFSAIFGLGEDDRHIAPLDMAGVSMASIQALHGKMAREMAEKDAEISALRERLAVLEELVAKLAAAPQ